jgi:type II secretion system protein I
MTRPAGFTLLEVLVAVALLAGGTTALLRVAGTSTDRLAIESRRARALLAAQALLADAELAPPPLGRREGVRSDGFAWTTVVEATPHPRLRQVTVRVMAEPERAIELVEVVRVPPS